MSSPEEAMAESHGSEVPEGEQDELVTWEPDWVSDTDLIAYLRCPYAWWHMDRELVGSEEILSPLDRKQAASDHALLGKVEKLALPAAEKELAELFTEDIKLVGIPTLENRERQIFGAPDGVDTAGGALAPIAIRAHKHVRRGDKLELAFQWMLLEPYRTREPQERRGILVLRRNHAPVPIEIELSDSYFEQVEALLEKIRSARETGVKARLCGCNVCSGPLQDRVSQQTHDGKDLTLLFEVGRGRASAFESVGIHDYKDIYLCDPQKTSEALREMGTHISPVQLEQMQFHARSYEEGRAILFGPPPKVSDSFIAVDLEYNSFRPHLWLIGIYLVDGDRFEFVPLWADSRRAERRNMEYVGEVLHEDLDRPVLTWAGSSADLPELKKTAARLGLDDVLPRIDERHIDLFAYARKILRLPIPELGLGEVAEFFGVPKTSQVGGGLEAQMLYDSYRSSRNPLEKSGIKYELISYNRDDLEALVETLRVVQTLPVEGDHSGEPEPPKPKKAKPKAKAAPKTKKAAKPKAKKKPRKPTAPNYIQVTMMPEDGFGATPG